MEGFGIVAAVIFVIVLIGVAMVVFTMIKRTVKLAFRLAIVGILLLIAAAGGFSLWWFGTSSTNEGKRPAPVQRTR